MSKENNTMQKDPLLYGVIGFLIGVVALWFLASNAFNNNNTGMMRIMGFTTATQQEVTANSDTIDAHFIEQMIPHHEDAITMAKLAQTKAQRVEVKELASNIVISQGKEINQMKDWYKDWFGSEVPIGVQVMSQHGMMGSSGMHMGMMGNQADIVTLENATDFDREFVEEMIPHHQMAVMMASMLKNGTQRPEMIKLADDIITVQTDEIDQMREWLSNWSK